MEHEVAFYCDNHASASEVEGVPFIGVDALRKIYAKHGIVITTSGKFQAEIKMQLNEADILYSLFTDLFAIDKIHKEGMYGLRMC